MEPHGRNGAGRAATQFKPGQSGNPGGRAKEKGLADYVRLKTRNGKELVDFMLTILRAEHRAVPLPVRMDAATWLADRGFGKPVQATEVSGANGGPIEFRDADAGARDRVAGRLDELAARRRARSVAG